MRITNIQPARSPAPPARITDASEIRKALEAAGVQVGPDPGHDGDWAACVDYQAGDRSIPEKIDLVAFGSKVKQVHRGTLSAAVPVWLELRSDGSARLVVSDEGDED